MTVLAAACGDGNEPFLTPTPAGIPSVEIANPYDTPTDPLTKRREGVFPVNLVLPMTDVSVWTTVRSAGDRESDELSFIVEGFVEAREGFFLDYVVTIADEQGNVYVAQPAFALGLLAPGDLRKFELTAELPSGATVKEITFASSDGDVSRRLVYHVDLALARVPSSQLLPERWEQAQ
jgi:hypothetical protein